MDSPSPVPIPDGFVVKNGSKIRCKCSGATPPPVSDTRAITRPFLKYLDAIDDGDPAHPVVVVLAEFVPYHWWEMLLHNQTALRLKLDLFSRRNTAVVDVPHHLDDVEAFE